jgi:hypothetical protein
LPKAVYLPRSSAWLLIRLVALALRAACGWLSSLRFGLSVIVLLIEHFTLSFAGTPLCKLMRWPLANLLLSADG